MTPTKHVKPSASEVMPMVLFSLTPEIIWPPVTMGPYPPPLRPLLKEARRPKETIFVSADLSLKLEFFNLW